MPAFTLVLLPDGSVRLSVEEHEDDPPVQGVARFGGTLPRTRVRDAGAGIGGVDPRPGAGLRR